MAQADNIFSYCVGTLALITTITSVLLYCRQYYLPTSQLRLLDDILSETKNIYHRTYGEGLLPPIASKYAETQLNSSVVSHIVAQLLTQINS
jgi:hypothetical protein